MGPYQGRGLPTTNDWFKEMAARTVPLETAGGGEHVNVYVFASLN